ncbi:hypothetical protein D9M71_262710 [compost metagenome]
MGSNADYKYLGTHTSKERVHLEWQKEKVIRIEAQVTLLENIDFKDKRIFPALDSIIGNIEEDIKLGRETLTL